MGGVWERMVRSVKESMTALDDGRKLKDELLLTILADAEKLINSRPLVYMPHTPDDPEALTPNHFLLGRSSGLKETMMTGPNLAETLRSSYKRSRYLAIELWDRWIKEYFPSLNLRSKWQDDNSPLREGNLVFIAEGQRRDWIRGIVVEVHAGSDGRIREAMVRTATGKTIRRPAIKFAILPTEVDRDSD